ncbi:MAG: hypothetical protein R3330_20070, partial [Saprospiraceae bacterium]|nr:hypothetical protein [Saprospiraceae bacterium]
DTGATGGILATEEQDRVEDVRVDLINQNGTVMQTFVTSDDGAYHFINPLLTYTIDPLRDDNHKNGVSTLDLVRIQKHLLGLEAFDTPYKYIAADANNSESVSAIDLIEIRKLILGVTLEFPNNESWRFVDADFTFQDETHPWPFDEVIELMGGLSMSNDFVAVKVGDVNGTVTANAQQVQTRNANGVLRLETAEQQVTAGQEVVVKVRSTNFDGIYGHQYTLLTEGLKIQGVESGVLEMGAENIGIHKGSVTASWHTIQPVAVSSEDVLYTLKFVATQSGQLSEMLSMSSRVTEAEAYDSNEGILDVALVILSLPSGQAGEGDAVSAVEEYALYQN